MTRAWRLVTIGLGLSFIVAAVRTLLDGAPLISFLAAIGFGPRAAQAGSLVVACDCTLGAWLVSGFWDRLALRSATIAFGVYAGALAYAFVAFGPSMECPCGVWNLPLGAAIARNAVGIVLCVEAAARLSRASRLSHHAAAAASAVIAALLVAAMAPDPARRPSPVRASEPAAAPSGRRARAVPEAVAAMGQSVTLRVVDELDAPVAGAVVRLLYGDGSAEELPGTDERGLASSQARAGTPERVAARREGFADFDGAFMSPPSGTPFLVRLVRSLGVDGIVVDARHEAAPARVELRPIAAARPTPSGYAGPYVRTTGEDGRFAFSAPRFDWAQIVAVADGGRVGEALVRPESARGCTVVVRALAAVALRVIDADTSQALTDFCVIAVDRTVARELVNDGGVTVPTQAMTALAAGADQAYRGRVLPGRHVFLGVSATHTAFVREVVVTGDFDLEIRVRRCEEAAGTVCSAADAAGVQATVTLLPSSVAGFVPTLERYLRASGAAAIRRHTAPDGSIRIPRTPDAAVLVEADGFSRFAGPVDSDAAAPRFELEPLGSLALVFAFRDASGAPVPHAVASWRGGSTQADESGDARATALPAAGAMSVTAAGFVETAVALDRIDTGASSVRIALSRTRPIAVELVGPASAPASGVTVVTQYESDPRFDGTMLGTASVSGADGTLAVAASNDVVTVVETVAGDPQWVGSARIAPGNAGPVRIWLSRKPSGAIGGRLVIADPEYRDTVIVTASPRDGGLARSVSGVAGEDYLLRGLAPGAWRVSAATTRGIFRCEQIDVTVEDGITQALDLALVRSERSGGPPHAARVSVVLAGRPNVGGAWASVAGWGSTRLRRQPDGTLAGDVRPGRNAAVWIVSLDTDEAFLWKGVVPEGGLVLDACLAATAAVAVDDLDGLSRLGVETADGTLVFERPPRELPECDGKRLLRLPGGRYVVRRSRESPGDGATSTVEVPHAQTR